MLYDLNLYQNGIGFGWFSSSLVLQSCAKIIGKTSQVKEKLQPQVKH